MIVMITLVLLGVVYAASRRNLCTRAGHWRVASLAAGGITLIAALAPPVHELAESRLSAHMLQHELLIVIAAPLLALARVDTALLLWLAPAQRRFTIRWLGRLRIGMPAAWPLHALALWIWHVPFLYEMAVHRPLWHAAEHATFFATALLFW